MEEIWTVYPGKCAKNNLYTYSQVYHMQYNNNFTRSHCPHFWLTIYVVWCRHEFRSCESHLSDPDHVVEFGSGTIKDSLKPQASLVLFPRSFAKATTIQLQSWCDLSCNTLTRSLAYQFRFVVKTKTKKTSHTVFHCLCSYWQQMTP